MSRSALKAIQAAAGNAGEAVYVDDVFSTFLYDGDGASDRALVNGMNLSETGGLIWSKRRSTSQDHYLVDTERGFANFLASNQVNPQYSSGSTGIRSFNTDGYNIGSDNSYNNSSSTYCSWTFLKQEGFFDVVAWDGDGTGAGRVISHNLGSVPGMIIVKSYVHPSGVGNTDWQVYHRQLNGGTNPEQYGIKLNGTGAESSRSWWNNTAPTSTQFTIGGGQDLNGSGGKYIAYLFAHDAQDFGTDSDESIIKCGSFTGNATVGLGFEPQWVMIKRIDNIGNWFIQDSMRGIPTGGIDATLFANLSNADNTNSDRIDLTSTGFIAKYGTGTETWIYVAIRRPHKPAEEFAATDLFDPVQYTGNAASTRQITTGFPVDLTIGPFADYGSDKNVFDRMRGASARLVTHGTAAEASTTAYVDGFDTNDGVIVKSTLNSNGDTWNGFMFQRAPGFFDVVAYTGTNSGTQNVNHNLGVTPELMIGKGRDYATNWYVFVNGVTNNGFLQSNGAFVNSYRIGAPTSTTFEVRGINSTATSLNGPHDYIAYLFATVPGISKVGSYSGTGSDVDVDCGFSAGARFVMVKRSDSTGDWYVWDTERGIVAGNDPYTRMNNNAPDTTNTDYIDPLSSGFTITSSAPAELNASGGTYIFLAIA